MGVQPFLIANTRVGLEKDMEPWLLPNDAYPNLEDSYLWRGRVKKRLCYNLLGRLKRSIGTTDGAGNLALTNLQNPPLTPGASQFVVGTTIYQDPNPNPGGDPVTMLTDGVGVAHLNRNAGTVVIAGGPLTTNVDYYPGNPVMGLNTLETITDNQETLVAFDTVYSYVFDYGTQSFVDFSNYKGGTTIVNWTGTNHDFFWSTNYQKAFWVTNGTKGFQGTSESSAGTGDGIRWHDQSIGGTNGWVNFMPKVDTTNYLMGALIIVPYKNRLVCLSTTEGTAFAASTDYNQRARWSQNGTPFPQNDQSGGGAPIPTGYTGGQDNNAWQTTVVGKGGYIDAPTLEKIISTEFVKDSLIVYFERSTWNLRYTGNELLPFIWEKINTELGAESTFSVVPFDLNAIAMGDTGIHACDTISVQRIDQRIPDEVFDIQNANNGPQRVYGIRDFWNQLVYWSIPYVGELDTPEQQALIFPNRILVYNYIDQSFSFFNDSFTCFGYFQPSNSLTWGGASMTWGEANFTWGSGQTQSEFPDVVGGNQQGFVEILMKDSFNDDSLIITNITPGTPTTTIVSINHNLQPGDSIKITQASGISGLIGKIYLVFSVSDANTFTVETLTAPTGTFTGNGTITTINNINVTTKRFSPFMDSGTQVRLSYVDFYLDTTTNGQISVNLYINDDSTLPTNSPLVFTNISTVSSLISAITVANPAVITVANGSLFKENDVVFLANVNGMTQIN